MSHYRDPLRDLFRLQDRMNRVFDELTQRQTRTEAKPEDELEPADWVPAADLSEHEQEYVIAIDLPGIDRQQLEIEIEKDHLVVRGERAADAKQMHRSERPAGRFRRRFSVPANADQSAIVAEYKDGVLRVRLPKRNAEQTARVRIPVS